MVYGRAKQGGFHGENRGLRLRPFFLKMKNVAQTNQSREINSSDENVQTGHYKQK